MKPFPLVKYLILFLFVVGVGFLVASTFDRFVFLPVGRYQLVRAADSAALRIDTVTGKVEWHRGGTVGWVELGK